MCDVLAACIPSLLAGGATEREPANSHTGNVSADCYFNVCCTLMSRKKASCWVSQVDVGVIETGLGGLRDATNVIEADKLACAVITAIDTEHLQALGLYST